MVRLSRNASRICRATACSTEPTTSSAMPVLVPPSTRRLLHQGVELAASRLDQRLHAAEPLLHPGLVHGLLEASLPGSETLHLHLGDNSEERPADVGEDAEARRGLGPVVHPRIELLEERDQFVAAAVLGLEDLARHHHRRPPCLRCMRTTRDDGALLGVPSSVRSCRPRDWPSRPARRPLLGLRPQGPPTWLPRAA